MKTIDRTERLGGAPFEIEEIEPMIYPAPLEGNERLAAIVEDRVSELAAERARMMRRPLES
jgi:hypothetical protein